MSDLSSWIAAILCGILANVAYAMLATATQKLCSASGHHRGSSGWFRKQPSVRWHVMYQVLFLGSLPISFFYAYERALSNPYWPRPTLWVGDFVAMPLLPHFILAIGMAILSHFVMDLLPGEKAEYELEKIRDFSAGFGMFCFLIYYFVCCGTWAFDIIVNDMAPGIARTVAGWFLVS